MIQVTIPGEPVGKGRPRVTRTGHAFTPPKTRAWTTKAAKIFRAARVGEPITDAVRVIVVAVKARPQRLLRKKDPAERIWRTTKPDGDNVAKAVLDAATKADVWGDDAQVARLEVRSVYAAKGEGACVEVWIMDCDGGELAQLRERMRNQETRTDADKAAFRELLTEYQRLEGNGPSPTCAEEPDNNGDGWGGHIERATTATTPTDDSATAAQLGIF